MLRAAADSGRAVAEWRCVCGPACRGCRMDEGIWEHDIITAGRRRTLLLLINRLTGKKKMTEGGLSH